jgi:hypothetical protein
MTRSRKKLDMRELEQLAFVGCSLQEIAIYVVATKPRLRRAADVFAR